MLTSRHVTSRRYNPALRVAAVIINQHEERTVGGQTWLDELTSAATDRGLPLLNLPIPSAW